MLLRVGVAMDSHIAPCSVNHRSRFFAFSSSGVQCKHSTGSVQQISTTVCSQVLNLWCFNKRCTHAVCECVLNTVQGFMQDQIFASHTCCG